MSSRGRGRVILATFLLSLFVALAMALPERGGTALDAMASEWLQSRATDRGAIVFTWNSWLGDTALTGLLVAAVVILLVRRRWTAAVTVVVASVAAPLIDVALKQLFQRGRPDHAVEFITGTIWSFPSGHAMSSLVGYGWWRTSVGSRSAIRAAGLPSCSPRVSSSSPSGSVACTSASTT